MMTMIAVVLMAQAPGQRFSGSLRRTMNAS
jgi:hypothetical protein